MNYAEKGSLCHDVLEAERMGAEADAELERKEDRIARAREVLFEQMKWAAGYEIEGNYKRAYLALKDAAGKAYNDMSALLEQKP